MSYSPWRRWLNLALWIAAFLWMSALFVRSTDERQRLWMSADVAWQWMMGHALVKGELDQLYTVGAGERWLAEGFDVPVAAEMVTKLLRKGRDHRPMPDGIDGPLYPPVAGFAFVWQGCFSPRQAHQLSILLQCGCTVLSAWVISLIVQGRITSGEVLLILCFYPHHYAGMTLGQNHPFSLLLLSLGWCSWQRGRLLLAGLLWGCFIYKPVILAALVLIPFAKLQGRVFLGMCCSACLLCLATLPFTRGLEPWKRWLTVAQRASVIYELDRRWIWMSRDVSSLPRRAMWKADEFTEQAHMLIHANTASPQFMAINLEKLDSGQVYSPPWTKYAGWSILAIIAVTAIGLSGREMQCFQYQADAFLLLSSCLCIYRFMYYDLLLTVLPIILLMLQWLRQPLWLRVISVTVWLFLFGSVAHFLIAPSYALQTLPLELLGLLLLWTALAMNQVRSIIYARKVAV